MKVPLKVGHSRKPWHEIKKQWEDEEIAIKLANESKSQLNESKEQSRFIS